MAKGRRAKPSQGARGGQHSKQQTKKNASRRRSLANSQTNDYHDATFTLHDAARATDSKRQHTSGPGTSFRHMAMNFIRSNESMERDSDHDTHVSNLQREIEIFDATEKHNPTDASTVSASKHDDLTSASVEEKPRRTENATSFEYTAYSHGSDRRSRSQSSSSGEVVFPGRNNMKHLLTDRASLGSIRAQGTADLEILTDRVKEGGTSLPLEEHSMQQRSDALLDGRERSTSPSRKVKDESLHISNRGQLGSFKSISDDDSDSQEDVMDDYISNLRENEEANITSGSHVDAVALPKSMALHEAVEATENIATFHRLEESESEADNFDSSWSSDINSDDAAYDPPNFDMDGEFLERNMARMTDEHIARLFQKQEHLGWDADELQIFDGDEDFDISERYTNKHRGASNLNRRIRRGKTQLRPFLGDPLNDLLYGEDYGDFDVMDYERPSISKGKNKQLNPLLLDLSDSELAEGLRDAWASDRKKKRQKKKEREDLRAQGMLGRNVNDVPDLKAKYNAGMTLSQIEGELKGFLFNGQRESLSLPPMAKQERKIIHDVANSFGLKSKSQGSNKKRFTVLYKTSRTTEFDDVVFARLKAQLNRRFLPRIDGKNKRPSKAANGGLPAHTGYRDGEIVGGAAPELGAENRGRAMLEKMGWSNGTALGTSNNQGILTPIEQIMKNSRAGLG